MWWVYFLVPSGAILETHRERVFPWGYGHILLFTAIAATGAGLHVAASFIEDQTHISGVATVLCVAVPVGVFVLVVYALHTYLVREGDPFHLGLLAGTAAVLAVAVWVAAAGVPMAWCLLVVTVAPAVTVVGYEALGIPPLGGDPGSPPVAGLRWKPGGRGPSHITDASSWPGGGLQRRRPLPTDCPSTRSSASAEPRVRRRAGVRLRREFRAASSRSGGGARPLVARLRAGR